MHYVTFALFVLSVILFVVALVWALSVRGKTVTRVGAEIGEELMSDKLDVENQQAGPAQPVAAHRIPRQGMGGRADRGILLRGDCANAAGRPHHRGTAGPAGNGRCTRRGDIWRTELAAFLAVLFAALLLVAQGCATPSRLAAVPVQDTLRAEIPGIPNARYWVDADVEPFIRDALASAKREQAYRARTGHQGPLPPINFLAVSGGGDDGAFGAGLLVGWTASGTRPEFKGVTGISTGGLIAPFAFLGPEEDDTLREVYTMIGPANILKPRNLLAAITDDGMADNSPFWN